MKNILVIYNIIFLLVGNVLFSNIHYLNEHQHVHEGHECQKCISIENNSNYISDSQQVDFLNNNINQFDDFSTNSNITIKAVEVGKAASATPFFQIQLNPASFTARMAVAGAFTQSYDFRLVNSSMAFADIITQYS